MDTTEKTLQALLEQEKKARQQAEKKLNAKIQKLTLANKKLQEEIQRKDLQRKFELGQLNEIFREHHLPMLLVDPGTNKILSANMKMQGILQTSAQKLTGMPVEELLGPMNKRAYENYFGQVTIKLNQVKHNLHCSCFTLSMDNSRVKFILFNGFPKEQPSPEKSQKKDKAYETLVENSSDFIIILNERGLFKYVNRISEIVSGFSKEELINAHFTILVREDYRQKLIGFYSFQLKKKIPSTYIEFPIISKDGKEIWIGQTVDLNISPDGTVELFALSRDISERKRYEKALMLSEEKYRSIIENLELGLLEVDRNGIILKAYPQFCRLTGYESEDLIGKEALPIFVDEENRQIVAHESEKRKKGQSSVYEIKIFRKDRTPIWVMVSGAPYYNEKNEIAGTVGIHLDITSRKLMEEELKQAKSLAESSLKSKDLFVANISHEIRTPLNAIMGLNELLSQGELSEKQRKFVNAISKSSENLLLVVNDLLDFSKLESGKMELTIDTHELQATMDEVANLWKYKIEEKDLTFVRNIHISKQHYEFDATRLNGVISNLLHNALKFTDTGRITLSVQELEDEKESTRFLFKIEDTGIGITDDQLALIFESFMQAEPGTARKYGGTGLGLSIARELIEMMGGQLRASSEPGTGTCFQFELRFPKSTIQPKEPASYEYDPELVKNYKVLLVEDNYFNQMMAQTILENWDMQVVIANNGLEAIQQVRAHTFDLILMDIQMPQMDGIETTWFIRNELKLEIPILALTANAVQNDIKKYLEIGMNGYVLKPFKQNQLLNCLVETLFPKIQETNMNGGTMIKQSVASKTADDVCDLTNLSRNCMGDMAFMSKMMQIAHQEIELKTPVIRKHLAQREFPKIKLIIHALKPTIFNISTPETYELLLVIEKETPNEQWVGQMDAFLQKLDTLRVELSQRIS